MASKRYRVRSGSLDEWVTAANYTDALMSGLDMVNKDDTLDDVVSVLLDGDNEKLAVKFGTGSYLASAAVEKLPEAEFSTPDFVWHQSSESYFVCEKDGYDL